MFNSDLEKLLSALEKEGDDGTYPSINRQTAEYLHELVLKFKPKAIIEVGACVGYSTIWLGLAARSYGGTVITYEWGRDRCEILRTNIKEAGLSSTVMIIEDDAKKALKELLSKVEFAFIDATKKEYLEYFKLLEPLLESGAVVVADNILEPFPEKLKDFVEYVKNNPNYSSKLVEIGKGLLEIIKK